MIRRAKRAHTDIRDSTGWIKYIRDYIREDEGVCKVSECRPKPVTTLISLKDVNEHQRREKIHEWKNEQKACKWVRSPRRREWTEGS